MDTIKVNIDDVILFNPQPADGVWSWTGPNNFKNPGRQLTINNIQLQQGGVYTAKYISPDGCISVHDFMISLNSCTPTDITTDIAVNGIFLNSSDAVSVNVGSYLLIAPKQNDGLWKWTGPDGFTSTSNKISFLGIDVKQAGKYSATYYNANGCRSTKDISVTVNGSELCSTPIIPYVQVNGGNWLSVNYATVTSGGSFTFGPQPNDGGSWTWTGPGSFTSTSRQNTISEFNDTKAGIYSAIYTNSIGCISVLDFIVGKNNCTPVSITPTIKVNSVLSSRTDSIIVNSGSNISIELPVSSNDGILSWTGPNGLKADSSKMNLNNILNWSEGKFVATFISKDGCQSSQTINISVTGDDYCGTPIIPFIQVGTGKSINTDTATVSVGGKITFGPHPIIENSWNWYWTCPQITSNTNKRVLVIDAFSAVKSGIYKAIYVNAAGCMSFRNFNIKLKTATDIVNINENDKISFFPNPVVDVLTITNISFNTNINITNLAGQTMLSAKSTNMNHEVIMDVSKLKPGIYLINVENDSKQSFKFLKN